MTLPLLSTRLNRHLSVSGRGLAGLGFEETHEVLRIVESEALAYCCDGQIFVVKHLFGVGEKAIGDYILGGTTGLHAHQIAEISARQATLIGKIGYRWQTITKCFCADVII